MMDATEYHEALAQLAWQVELGVDECIGEAPSNRYDETAKPKVKVEKVAAPEVVVEQTHPAEACNDLESLRLAIESFDGCALKNGARNTVFCDGNPAARVMIIGEAPGRDEDQLGKPFVGRSGQLLDKMFAAIGLSRMTEEAHEAIYITNLLPWRPPQNRDPSAEEIVMMKPFLIKHISLIKPDYLVLVGGSSTKTLLDTTVGITRMRGNWAEVNGIPAMPIFHPAALLRDSLKKRPTWADLLALKARLNDG